MTARLATVGAVERRLVLGLLGLAAVCSLGAANAMGRAPVVATFVGDSVAAAISYIPSAQAELRRGMRVTLDLEVCRRLAQPSCPYQGSRPSTALQAVRGHGRTLGDVLILDVGYNESGQGYGEGIDQVMRAARRQGITEVVWLTLRETSDVYRDTNVAIKAAARRWPQLHVADWDAYSRGKPWYRDAGPHLTPTGAYELAAFLRRHVLEALRPTAPDR